MKGQTSARLKVRNKPLPGEIKLLEMIGGGARVNEAAKELCISRYTAEDRIRRLKYLSGRPSLPSLVHWGLTKHHFSYECYGLKEIDSYKLQIVQRVAQGQSPAKICEVMYLTPDQLTGRLNRARRALGATHQSNLVAICWTEGWII